jgi:ABC-type sugar transport system permease subunit
VVSNFYHSLTSWNGFETPKWIGFANFQKIVKDEIFWSSLRNLAILVAYIPASVLVTLILSAMLREGLPGWRFFRSVMYLPNILGYVILGMILNITFRDYGVVNTLLRSIGSGGLALSWIGSSKYAIHTVGALFVVWARLGFGCMYFLAAMSTIGSDIYDASKIDGAGWWRTFFSVTIPSVVPGIQFWIVLSFIEIFARMFGFLYAFTGGGPGFSTYTMEFSIYIYGFRYSQMGYGSAWAVILFFFCSLIAVAQIIAIRKKDS